MNLVILLIIKINILFFKINDLLCIITTDDKNDLDIYDLDIIIITMYII